MKSGCGLYGDSLLVAASIYQIRLAEGDGGDGASVGVGVFVFFKQKTAYEIGQ